MRLTATRHHRRRPTTRRIDRLVCSMTGRVWPLAVSSLCICIATTACSVQHRPKLQFSGELTSPSASCPTLHGTLVIQRGDVVFAPSEGTWTLEGKVVGSVVEASRSRPSFDHKIYTTTLAASVSDTKAVGTYVTPTCTYAVDLTAF